MRYQPIPRAAAAEVDYSMWSIEELWELASRMRVTGAKAKSRRELIELFAVPPKAERSARTAWTSTNSFDKELS
jgi:hypothetical protein